VSSNRRRLAIATLLVALVAGAAADRIARPRPEGDDAVAIAARMPTAAPTTALTSTWFCAAGTSSSDGRADHTVVIANPTTREVKGVVTAVPAEGDAVTAPVVIGARSRKVVRVADIVQSPYTAAMVDLEGGGVVVEHEVHGTAGTSMSPCAATGSDRWYIADGSTARDDAMLLALFNPFPEDAIVDLAFSTDQGRAVPSDFQGIVVRGGHLSVVDVGSHVRRRERVAATVTARSGRLVVDRLQFYGGAPAGISLALASPSLGGAWWFADGYAGDGVNERFSVYNPNATEAAVSLELFVDGESVEPFDLTVPAHDRLDIVANEQERIPKNVGHSAVIRSLNGVAVVAERAITATGTRSGISDTLGARTLASQWVLASGAADDAFDEWVSVLNPGSSPVQVSLTVLAGGQPLPVEGLQDIAVGPGKRASLRLTDHVKRADVPLVVAATGGRIVVERAVYGVGSPGVSLTAGIPLR
jgi:hypothetical protein